MQSEVSYRILDDAEVDKLNHDVWVEYKELSQKYCDLYCQKYKINQKTKGLSKSFWYITFFSIAYGEDVEENLKTVLNECSTPASVRSFAYKLNKKHEKTMEPSSAKAMPKMRTASHRHQRNRKKHLHY